MGIKKIGYGTHLIIYSMIVLAILAVINYISAAKFYRKDLTENLIYSISSATKDVLRGIDDVVSIQAYFSKELPPQLVELKSQVKDILDEYKAYAGSSLEIKFIDPDEDPELSQRMQFIGVPKVQVNIFQRDKAEVANLYLGMSIMFEDRKEVIPVIQNVNNLEYDLTSAILKVTKEEPEVIGFLSWQQAKEDFQHDLYSKMQMALQKQYEVRNVNLSAGESMIRDIDTLVLISPEEVTDKEKYILDQFLMRGGKQIYLVDMVKLKPGRQLAAEAVSTKITDLLSHYGVNLNTDLVLDRSSSMAAFSGGFFHFQVPYPFWPKVVKDGFDSSHPMVSKLDTITMPWTSSISIQDKIITEKVLHATILAQTTPHGWTQKGRFNLDPQQRFNTGSDTLKRIPLAILISGRFESFYANKDAPYEGIKKAEGDKNEDSQRLSIAEKDAQIVVVGNSRFIQDDFLGRFPENATFFLNVVDWLTMGESLIGIRSREKTERPLPEMSETKKAFIRYVNIFGVSILLIMFGLVKFLLKKRRSLNLYES
ncbi:Gldg family protein [bacterium]|nr:Gldg family protein [bacterium]